MKIIKTTRIFDQWLSKLRNKIVLTKINARLRSASNGNLGDVKPVGGGVSEMRIHTGAGYRIYFIEKELQIIVLLCGGDKPTQQKDIKKAKQLAKEL